MAYHANDAARAEQRAGRSYAGVYIGVGVVVIGALIILGIGRLIGPMPVETPAPAPADVVVIASPGPAKIQDRVEAPRPLPPPPEAAAQDLKPAVDLAPVITEAEPGVNPAQQAEPTPVEPAPAAPVAAPPVEGRIQSSPFGEEISRKPLRRRHFSGASRRKEITHRNTVRRMPPGLRRVLAEGAGRAVGCPGDCSLPALFCKATARGAGLIR
jgi:hypothetical protein